MIGWNISVNRQKCFKRLPARAKTSKGKWVASWSADVGGIEWLEKLVGHKNAICLRDGFYPGLFTAKAKYIFDIIQDMPPEVKKGINWVEDKEKGWINPGDHYYFDKSEQEIASCNNEEWLIIEVWDLS